MIREHLEVSKSDIFDQKNEAINCDEIFILQTKEEDVNNNSSQQVIDVKTEATKEVKNEPVYTLEVELEKSDEIPKNNCVKVPYSHHKSNQVFNKPDSDELSSDRNKKELHKKKHLRFSKMRSEVDFCGYVHHSSNHKHRKKHEKSNTHQLEHRQKELNSNYLLTGQHNKNYIVDSLYREQLGMKPYGADFSQIDIDNMLIDNQEHGIMSPNLTIKRKYSDPVCHDVEKFESNMRFEDSAHDEKLIMPNMECSKVSSHEMVKDHGDSDYNDTRSQTIPKTPHNAMEPLLYKTNIDQYGLYDIIPMKQKRKRIKQHRVPRQDPLLYNPAASHHAFLPSHRKQNKEQDYMECDYTHELPHDYTKCTIPNDIDINNHSDELEEMDHCSLINPSSLENVVKSDTKYRPPCRPYRMKRKVNNNIYSKDRSISDFYEEVYEDDINNQVMENMIKPCALQRSIKKINTKDTGICVSGSSITNHYKTMTIKRNQEVQMDEKQFMQNKMFSVGTECAFPIRKDQKLERDLLSNDTSIRNPREQILEIKHLLTSCLKELITDTKHNETSRTDMYKCCSSSKCCCTLEDSFSHTYIELPSGTCKQCNKIDTLHNSESCQNCDQSKSPTSIFHDYLISNQPVNNKSWKGYDCDTRRCITRSTQLSESCKSVCITNSVNNTSVKVYDDPRSAIHKEITIDGHTYILLDNANKLCKDNVKNDTKEDLSEPMSRQCCGRYAKNERTTNTYPNNIIEIEKDKQLPTDLKSTETFSTAKYSIKDKLEKQVVANSKNDDAHNIHASWPADTVETRPDSCPELAIEHSLKSSPDITSPVGIEKLTAESSPISSPEYPLERLKMKPFIKKKQLEYKVAALPREELKIKPINNIYNCIKKYLKKRYKLANRKYEESKRESISDHCNEHTDNLLGDMGEIDLIKMRLNQRSKIGLPNINSNKVSIFDTFRFDNNCVSYKAEFPSSCLNNNGNAKCCIDTLDTEVINFQSQRKPPPFLHGLMNAQRTIPNDYSYRRQMPVPIYSSTAINTSSNNCHGGQSRLFLVAQKSELVLDSNLMLQKPEIDKESDDDVSRTSEGPTSVFARILKNFRKPRYRERREKILDTAYKNDNFGSTLSGNPSSRMYAYVKTPVCVMPLQRWNSYPNHTVESQHQKRCVSHESTFRTEKKKKHKQKRTFFDFKGKNIKDDTGCSSDSSDNSDCDLELAKKVISRRMRNRKYYSDNEMGKMKCSSAQMSKNRSKGKNKYKEIGVQAKIKYPQINKKRSPGAKMDKTGDTLRESMERFWLSTLQSDKKEKKPFSRRKKYKSPFANPLYAMMRSMQGREAKFRIPKTRVKPIM